ncbi:hypothetical protein [Pseudobacteriovorax antillogorgiicola]|uniref:Chemotaxis phosphatase CheX n=1 Tax=Pseudobacteriovorax antillogorgiicola TaxID=1513793 RepID=A0A1Y6BLE9_9BACT|nr:hypothetical protein [Pseudobacteriovorax antillogorgiicola]TCS56203.1 hypothetical protein EDD56_10425 [Pseudobacteriovorax antillogorgiicola]SMF08647.1 hypothetical protein SAMN06296036_104309 [Pseudobacteriovorax antillogorgiicola]
MSLQVQQVDINEAHEPSPALKSLFSIVESVSKDKLDVSTRSKVDIKVEPHEVESMVFGKWMAMILLCGPDLEVTFKLHYDLPIAIKILESCLPKGLSNDPQGKVSDFFQELCNTCAGEVKAILDKQKIVVGLSLPLSLRGSDEIMFSQRKNYHHQSNYWLLATDQGNLVCSTHIDIVRPERVAHIEVPKEPIKTKKRKIAFL